MAADPRAEPPAAVAASAGPVRLAPPARRAAVQGARQRLLDRWQRPRLLPGAWVAVLTMAMVLTSDYKLRTRAPGRSLAGQADLAVLAELIVYGLVAAFLLFQLARPLQSRRGAPLLVATWMFGLVLAMTALYAVYPTLALARGVQLLITCGLAHCIALWATRAHLHRLVHAYVVIVALSVAFGVAFRFPRALRQEARFNWLHVHPVMAATYLGLAVVLLLGLLIRNRRRAPTRPWPNWAYIGLLAVAVGGLLATRTRGALAGCVLGCFVVAMTSVRRKSRLDVVVLSAVVGVIVAIIASEDILTFLKRGETTESLSTLSARTELWNVALDLFGERPVLGYGLTASRGLFFDSVGLGGAHNGLINLMVDAGLFGVVAGVALIVLLIRTARRVPRTDPGRDDVPLILGAIAFLLGNSFTVEFLATPANVANVWLLILVGWALLLHRPAPGVSPSPA